jgi:hypothetical protein
MITRWCHFLEVKELLKTVKISALVKTGQKWTARVQWCIECTGRKWTLRVQRRVGKSTSRAVRVNSTMWELHQGTL